MIKVLLADDHDLVRTGMRRLLEDLEDVEVIAEATTGEEAIQAVRNERPQVVLMDINMPGIGGLEATRKILQYDDSVRVIVVTMNEDDLFAKKLLKIGAAGYLTKGCKIDEISHAIREAVAGRRYITPQIAQQLALANSTEEEASPFDELSEREMQVMMMIMNGQRINEISEKMCLSPKTVSTYRHRLYSKLNISNDVELARLALRHGIFAAQS